VAEDSGEGRWAVLEAVERGVAMPAISAALQARFVSQLDETLTMKAVAALRNQFGGHAVVSEAELGAEGDPQTEGTDRT
jgi:6-phosphogluconate dehydrogenase